MTQKTLQELRQQHILSTLKDLLRWQVLQDKLTLAEEMRLKNISMWMSAKTFDSKGRPVDSEGKPFNMSFESIFKTIVAGDLTEKEIKAFEEAITINGEVLTGTPAQKMWAVYKEISGLGKELSKQIAEIRFPSNPIMNDMLYEHLSFGEAGAEFYRRRIGGDFPGMAQSEEEMMQFITNPADLEPQKALEILLKAINALSSPQGLDSAQNNFFPLLVSYFRFIQKGGDQFEEVKDTEANNRGEVVYKYHPVGRWFRSQSLYAGARHLFNAPTSIAQLYGRKDAPAVDEIVMQGLANEAVKMGITRGRAIDPKSRHTLRERLSFTSGLTLTERLSTSTKLLWPNLDHEIRKKLRIRRLGVIGAVIRDLFLYFLFGQLKGIGEESTKGSLGGKS